MVQHICIRGIQIVCWTTDINFTKYQLLLSFHFPFILNHKGLKCKLCILKESTDFKTFHELINSKNLTPQTQTIRTSG